MNAYIHHHACAGRLYAWEFSKAAGAKATDDAPHELRLALNARQDVRMGYGNYFVDLCAAKLGLRTGGLWREALSTALIGDWALPLHLPDGLSVTGLGALRGEALVIRRQLTPLWRRRANGSRVVLLDTPLGEGISLYDLISGSPSSPELGLGCLPDNPRLTAILNALAPDEQKITLAWAHPAVANWTEAALAAGVADPVAAGVRVRRKLKRLGEKYTDRAHAATVTRSCAR
ncbi:hypothetical protein ABZT34_32045 [Streptomyces sp. NPDC005329]|uniref:hypothetical protein n=1 Tax=Streptomyces sp. NPDC005329 TaxID=3157034 RepID=UPI0033A59A10